MYKTLYYDVKKPGSYCGVDALARYVPDVKRKTVKKWLESQDTYTIHKPFRRKFRRRKVITGGINHQSQADLVDLQNIKRVNDNTAYLLTCIDVFSKYAYVIPLKNKTGASLVIAFKKIFNQLEKLPYHLQTDAGTEFLNKSVQNYLKEIKVKHFITWNRETKSSIVEIFNRTLKRRMFRYFTKHNTRRYIDILPALTESYNNTYHRSIKLAPSQVNRENQEEVWQRLYGGVNRPDSKPLPLGARVRLSKAKGIFEKGYLPNWTEELFTISQVLYRTTPITYKVKDDAGEVLRGTFYREELQIVAEKEVYRVANILKKRTVRGKKEYLIEWSGYPSSFNSWVPAKDIQYYE